MSAGHQVLVAGVGNVFLGDDGFGPEVVRQLAGGPLPEGVRAVDVGIRGLHLAYELLEARYALLVLVDAMPRGNEPGTLVLLEPDLSQLGEATPDAHGMDPLSVFRWLLQLGGEPPPTRVLGVEPSTLAEGMGLSAPCRAAVPRAVGMIHDLLAARGDAPCA